MWCHLCSWHRKLRASALLCKDILCAILAPCWIQVLRGLIIGKSINPSNRNLITSFHLRHGGINLSLRSSWRNDGISIRISIDITQVMSVVKRCSKLGTGHHLIAILLLEDFIALVGVHLWPCTCSICCLSWCWHSLTKWSWYLLIWIQIWGLGIVYSIWLFDFDSYIILSQLSISYFQLLLLRWCRCTHPFGSCCSRLSCLNWSLFLNDAVLWCGISHILIIFYFKFSIRLDEMLDLDTSWTHNDWLPSFKFWLLLVWFDELWEILLNSLLLGWGSSRSIIVHRCISIMLDAWWSFLILNFWCIVVCSWTLTFHICHFCILIYSK